MNEGQAKRLRKAMRKDGKRPTRYFTQLIGRLSHRERGQLMARIDKGPGES